MEIMRGMEGMKKHWSAQVSINSGNDEEWLAQAKKSGCALVQIGIESIFQDGLQSMNKKQNKTERFKDQLKRIRESGIAIIGTFLFGFDNEPVDILERTLEFALENRIDYLNCSVITPFPGTVLYDRLKAEKRLVNDVWWQHPYSWYDLLYEPRGGELSNQEIEDGIFNILGKFYKTKEIFKRLKYRLKYVPKKLTVYEYLMFTYGQFFEALYNKDRRCKGKQTN